MALKVIGSGFGRTGTMSLKLALEALGFGKCHHMEEVFENPGQVPRWRAALAGQPVDWQDLMSGYTASVDWPSSHFWRELSEANPEALVVHTVRPAEAWWASYSETIMKFIEIALSEVEEGPVRAMSEWSVEAIGRQTFGTDFTDREAALRAFEKRQDDVRAAIPEDRLLVFNVAEGWTPICDFLGLPVPDTPFPRANNRQEFWHNFTPVNVD